MARRESPPFLKKGDRFGRLVVQRDLGRIPYGSRGTRRQWLCRCDCGNTVKQVKSQLVSGAAKSCGCLQPEVVGVWASEHNVTHGHKRGGVATHEYQAWRAMINRCYNQRMKAYKDYGARGITVCRRWRESFEAFLADVGPRPPGLGLSIGRKDNDGNYTPKNVRWETRKQQARNRRSGRFITAHGERLTLVEWSERTGIGRTTLRQRIDLGWSSEDVVDRSLRSGGYRRK